MASKKRPPDNIDLSYIEPALHPLAVPITSLLPDPANARRHDQKNLNTIQSSLERFGQQRPIVVKEDGTVVAGNGTLTVALLLGWTHLAVVRTQLTGYEAMAYALVDNRSAELATWDFQELASTFGTLVANNPTAIEGLGWEAFEYEPLLAVAWAAPPTTVEEKNETPPVVPVGDVTGLVTMEVTAQQYATIVSGVERVRVLEKSLDITIGRGLELIVGEFLSTP